MLHSRAARGSTSRKATCGVLFPVEISCRVRLPSRAQIVILAQPVKADLKRCLASLPGANWDAFLTRGFSRVVANGLADDGACSL
jgi:hypothetical protein